MTGKQSPKMPFAASITRLAFRNIQDTDSVKPCRAPPPTEAFGGQGALEIHRLVERGLGVYGETAWATGYRKTRSETSYPLTAVRPHRLQSHPAGI